MREITLPPSQGFNQGRLVAIAMGEPTDGASYRYRISRVQGGAYSTEGPELIFATDEQVGQEVLDGLTPSVLISICLDRIRQNSCSDPAAGYAAMRLQAALRVLADQDNRLLNVSQIKSGGDPH